MKEISKQLYYKISKPFISLSVNLGITANQLSIFNHVITLTFGCYWFVKQKYLYALAVCLINGFLDYLDGDVAKATSGYSKLGIWLDSGFDVIVQNAVLGCIGLGCFFSGLNIWWIFLFFVSNCANNFVSFNYNQTFGFDSYNGNELFRKFMDKRCHFLNRIIKDMIDPTTNHFTLALYTYRYWIVLGCFWNMKLCFMIMTLISTVKWIVMFLIYGFYLNGDRFLFVLRALSYLDEESDEFYQLSNSRSV